MRNTNKSHTHNQYLNGNNVVLFSLYRNNLFLRASFHLPFLLSFLTLFQLSQFLPLILHFYFLPLPFSFFPPFFPFSVPFLRVPFLPSFIFLPFSTFSHFHFSIFPFPRASLPDILETASFTVTRK